MENQYSDGYEHITYDIGYMLHGSLVDDTSGVFRSTAVGQQKCNWCETAMSFATACNAWHQHEKGF